MLKLENKQIRVGGRGGRGQAAGEFLRRSGASVLGDHPDRYENVEGYARANARLFRNQQASDWSRLFTPCAVAGSLLEAVTEAAKNVTSGDVVLLVPACSSWDQFQNHPHRGDVFFRAVKSIGRGYRHPQHKW